jgi:prepilin-type N-terminal cleavage/methylation domain-containing protein
MEACVRDRSRGFTLVELLVATMIMGVLIAMAVTNYGAMQKRAREASTKSNMHTFQLAAEDYGVRNNSAYPTNASQAAGLLTRGGSYFYNPFYRTTGSGNAWLDQGTWARPIAIGSTRAGIVTYGDSAGAKYQIVGRGATAVLPLVLTNGQ